MCKAHCLLCKRQNKAFYRATHDLSLRDTTSPSRLRLATSPYTGEAIVCC